MPTVLITGGTGMIGKALVQALLEKGYDVSILTRQLPGSGKGMKDPGNQERPGASTTAAKIQYFLWDVTRQTVDQIAFINADFIINLAGAGVADQRWTQKRKEEIRKSRVDCSKLIVDSLKAFSNQVKAVISASAIGWYGADPISPGFRREGTAYRKFEEPDPPANNFLGNTCKQWEQSIEPVAQLGKRLVKLRIGIVLSKEGGALKEFLKPLKFGVAAILGSGRQIISWIHIDDLVNMFISAIENEKMSGAYNAVAPYPVSNKELTLELARIRKGKFFTPVHIPSFLLKLVLGEMSVEVLKSATVSSSKIQIEGFTFQFPLVNEALEDLK